MFLSVLYRFSQRSLNNNYSRESMTLWLQLFIEHYYVEQWSIMNIKCYSDNLWKLCSIQRRTAFDSIFSLSVSLHNLNVVLRSLCRNTKKLYNNCTLSPLCRLYLSVMLEYHIHGSDRQQMCCNMTNSTCNLSHILFIICRTKCATLHYLTLFLQLVIL